MASLRASGRTLIRMYDSIPTSNGNIWRLLNGPTSKVWIDPMVNYLKSLGVQFYTNTPLVGINYDGKEIKNFIVQPTGSSPIPVYADFYVSSLPVEKFTPIVTVYRKYIIFFLGVYD